MLHALILGIYDFITEQEKTAHFFQISGSAEFQKLPAVRRTQTISMIQFCLFDYLCPILMMITVNMKLRYKMMAKKYFKDYEFIKHVIYASCLFKLSIFVAKSS